MPTSLAALILPESPKRGTRAAGTSEKEVRFGISLCAAMPPTSAGGRTYRPRGRDAVGSKTAFSGPAKNASPPRTACSFHCCTPSFSTDADLIAESICLVSASEVRRERSVLATKACNEGSKPQDIPSDQKTRQGASAEARYDTSNAGVLAR